MTVEGDWSQLEDWEVAEELRRPVGSAVAVGQGQEPPSYGERDFEAMETRKARAREVLRERDYDDEEIDRLEAGDWSALHH